MNKAGLIEAITDKVGDKRTAAAAVDAVLETITRTVSKGESVALTGFGVFEKADRAARTARNPATGATIKLKKTSLPKFRAGQGFKDVVSGAKKLPAPAKAAAKTAAKAPARAASTTRSVAATARKTAAAVKAPAKAAVKAATAPASKAPAKTAAKAPAKRAPATKAPAKAAAKKAPATKAPAKKAAAKKK